MHMIIIISVRKLFTQFHFQFSVETRHFAVFPFGISVYSTKYTNFTGLIIFDSTYFLCQLLSYNDRNKRKNRYYQPYINHIAYLTSFINIRVCKYRTCPSRRDYQYCVHVSL